MNDSLEKYFTEKLLAPVAEWQKEAAKNKEFYLGEKCFRYVVTLTGHEPSILFPEGLSKARIEEIKAEFKDRWTF